MYISLQIRYLHKRTSSTYYFAACGDTICAFVQDTRVTIPSFIKLSPESLWPSRTVAMNSIIMHWDLGDVTSLLAIYCTCARKFHIPQYLFVSLFLQALKDLHSFIVITMYIEYIISYEWECCMQVIALVDKINGQSVIRAYHLCGESKNFLWKTEKLNAQVIRSYHNPYKIMWVSDNFYHLYRWYI